MKCIPLVLSVLPCAPVLAQSEAIPPEIDNNFQQYCTLGRDLLPILKCVSDKETADAAAPLLEKQQAPLYILKKRFDLHKSLPDGVKEAIAKKYELTMRQVWGDVYAEIYRLQKAQCFASIKFAKELQTYCTLLNQ